MRLRSFQRATIDWVLTLLRNEFPWRKTTNDLVLLFSIIFPQKLCSRVKTLWISQLLHKRNNFSTLTLILFYFDRNVEIFNYRRNVSSQRSIRKNKSRKPSISCAHSWHSSQTSGCFVSSHLSIFLWCISSLCCPIVEKSRYFLLVYWYPNDADQFHPLLQPRFLITTCYLHYCSLWWTD